jgi:hypothetical protein
VIEKLASALEEDGATPDQAVTAAERIAKLAAGYVLGGRFEAKPDSAIKAELAQISELAAQRRGFLHSSCG